MLLEIKKDNFIYISIILIGIIVDLWLLVSPFKFIFDLRHGPCFTSIFASLFSALLISLGFFLLSKTDLKEKKFGLIMLFLGFHSLIQMNIPLYFMR